MSAVKLQQNTDIDEIISLLEIVKQTSFCSFNDKCLERITLHIDDKVCDKRAEELKNNSDFIHFIKNISSSKCKTECCNCAIKKYCNFYIKSEREKISDNKPVLVDLFCGSGGLSLGFTQSGYEISFANDIEACCIETYRFNHPQIPSKYIIKEDINNIINEIDKLKRFSKTDIIIGGPPCQGFSEANRQRLIDDPRNYLYKSYVKVVDNLRPKFFVMENVRGMKKVINEIKDDFEAVGYSISAHTINAKDFGIPQNRERLIIIGNRINIDNEKIFENIIKKSVLMPKRVLSDALYGLNKLEASKNKNSTENPHENCGGKIIKAMKTVENDYINNINNNKIFPYIFNHQARYNNDRDIEIFSRLKQGNKSDDPKISDIMPYKNRNHIFKDKYFKLENNKICKTITAHMKFDCNMYIHPEQARGLTPREAARIQSYPDDYFFKGSFTKTYMQIGNSVPPMLAKIIADEIKKYL